MPVDSPKDRITARIEAFATVSIWGATFVATKIALQEVSPATVVWARFGMGLVVLGLAASWRGELSIPRLGDWPYLILLGFIGVGLHQWLQANGLQTAQATTTAWIVATTPVFVALLGWLVLREHPSARQLLGIAIAAIGVLLIVSRGDLQDLFHGTGATPGDILILISAPNWAIYTILSRQRLGKMAAAQMMFFVMLSGWLFTSLWIFGLGPGLLEIGDLSLKGWAAIASLGVFGSGLAYIMYYDALRVLPAAHVGAFLYIEPLTTMLLAAPLLGEVFSSIMTAGAALILAGIYLVNQTRKSGPAPGQSLE